jgi:hypothetical protein
MHHFFGEHTYLYNRAPNKIYSYPHGRSIAHLGDRARLWALQCLRVFLQGRRFYKWTPHKSENAIHGRSHEVLGFLATLWALKCGNMFSQDEVFGQALAHKIEVKFEGALEQMSGRAFICVGARVMYRFYIRLLFCRARNFQGRRGFKMGAQKSDLNLECVILGY